MGNENHNNISADRGLKKDTIHRVDFNHVLTPGLRTGPFMTTYHSMKQKATDNIIIIIIIIIIIKQQYIIIIRTFPESFAAVKSSIPNNLVSLEAVIPQRCLEVSLTIS